MRVLLIILLSVLGGLLAAFFYAASIGPDAGVKTLTLPGVIPVAATFGTLAGLLISPVMMWALKGASLKTAVPITYATSCGIVLLLNLIQAKRSMYLSFAATIVVLWVIRLFRNKQPKNGMS